MNNVLFENFFFFLFLYDKLKTKKSNFYIILYYLYIVFLKYFLNIIFFTKSNVLFLFLFFKLVKIQVKKKKGVIGIFYFKKENLSMEHYST
jgi:hypothetical protein